MAERISKSRTFAVVLVVGDKLGIYFFYKKTFLESGEAKLVHPDQPWIAKWPTTDRDEVINLLVQAGLTVRYYDPGMRQWMDHSLLYGLLRAPGPRDGTWGYPLLEDFDRDYLPIV